MAVQLPVFVPAVAAISRRAAAIASLAAGRRGARHLLERGPPQQRVCPLTTTTYGVRFTNPVGIPALGHPAWKALVQGAVVIAVATLGPAALAPLLRFRRADPVQRQQLKWFALVVGICVVSVLVTGAVRGVLPLVTTVLYYVPVAGVVVGLPAAVGLAILRYRLYDIDRLINRAVVYATLTVVLGLGYAGAVLVLGQLFGVGEGTPSWAVAGATLAVAVLFQPARRRIQQAVDRRFNRRKYNMAKTIEAYSTRLRDEIDLDTLSAELLAVVDQTMEPTRASVWLRPSRHGSSGTAPSEARRTPWAYSPRPQASTSRLFKRQDTSATDH